MVNLARKEGEQRDEAKRWLAIKKKNKTFCFHS